MLAFRALQTEPYLTLMCQTTRQCPRHWLAIHEWQWAIIKYDIEQVPKEIAKPRC